MSMSKIMWLLCFTVLLSQGCDSKSPVVSGAHGTVESGSIESVQKLLSAGTKVGSRDSDGNTLLHIAAERGNEKIFELLLNHDGDVHARNTYEMTPLHYAAVGGHTNIAKILLKKDAEVDAQNHGGWTPLYNAGMEGHVEICRFLIENGSDVNTQDRDGDTALHYAAGNGKLDVVKLFLSVGANPSIKNTNGETPLDRVRLRLDPRKNHPAVYKFGGQYAECAKVLANAGETLTTQTSGLASETVASWAGQKDFFVQNNFQILKWEEAKILLLKNLYRGGKQYHTGWLTIYTKDSAKYLTKQPYLDMYYDFMVEHNLSTESFGTE